MTILLGCFCSEVIEKLGRVDGKMDIDKHRQIWEENLLRLTF